MNRGGLTVPTVKWLKDYKTMEQIFNAYHPPKSLKKGRGLFKNFFKYLKTKFPYYDDKVLHLVTRVLTWFRVRTINKIAKYKMRPKKEPKVIAKQNKTKKPSVPITLRGKKQLAERSH